MGITWKEDQARNFQISKLATMSIYNVKQGQHPFTPSVSHRLSIRENLKGWWITIDESCRYELGGEDQNDWNKLAGLSFNLLNNHQNSAMFGWRWNPVTQVFEINVYCHIAGKVEMSETIFKTPANKEFAAWLEMDYKRNTVNFHIYAGTPADYEKVETTVAFKSLPIITREIGAWFGGNNPAPHQMILWKDRIIYYGNDIAYHNAPS